MNPFQSGRRSLGILLIAWTALLGGATGALLAVCGPFGDVSDPNFCPFVLEIFTLGITNGTSPATYDPAANVTRLQMAAFLSRTVDGALRRGSRRAALNLFRPLQTTTFFEVTTVGTGAKSPVSDGLDVWVPSSPGTVSRVRAGDGRLLETWTGAVSARAALSALGSIFVTGIPIGSGRLYRIDPRQPAGGVTTVASNLGPFPLGLAFDGGHIWTANNGSVSIVTPGTSTPWTVTTLPGFGDLTSALFDGANVWVTDSSAGTLLKLDTSGAALQTVTIGVNPIGAVFDGANIWVPDSVSDSVSVVRASTGAVLATLTGNGLTGPEQAAFDGERILVTGVSVSLWKAADLTVIGNLPTGGFNGGACSDGVNFWIAIRGNQLARF